MDDIKTLAARLDAALVEDANASIDNTGWITSRELAEAWDCTPRNALAKLTRLVAAGRMVRERRPMLNDQGSRVVVMMYREASDVTTD